ncbi:MAG: hypothetical protein QG599_563 [Pseudomonadota bacterium]|nr:hypothetical protein [Pseudomonadota bacterium]
MSIIGSLSTLRAPVGHPRHRQLGKFSALAVGALFLTAFGNVMAAPPVEVTGELDVIIKEDFDRGHFEHDYFLRDDDGQNWYQLEFERMPPGHLRSGQRIKVRGQPQGRKFQVESLDEQGIAALQSGALPDAQLTDARKAVVLMVDLTNAKASTRYTLAQITGQMYTNSYSVDGLYREASLGQTRFPADTDGNGQADVFGPLTINYDNSTCNYYDWAYAAEAAAQAAGVNLSLYRHRVFVLPRYSDLPACAWAGLANVGCGTYCRAWIAEGESGMVYAHELGHNLNLAHAGTDPENDGVINSVYGDYSDPMGLSRSWHVFNASHIDQMGWYASIPGAITTIVASGAYDLAAIGNAPMVSGAPSALKIAKPDTGDFYYLSYRQPISYDSSLSSTYTGGVNIHRYQGSGYGYTSHIKTLADGAVFTDSVNTITVTQMSRSSGYATVEISFGGSSGSCTAATPTVAMSPATITVRTGATASFAVAVANQDSASCTGTFFTLGYANSTVTGSLSPTSLTLAAGQTGNGSLAVNTSVADGRYSLTVSATDTDGVAPSHSSSGQGNATLVVDGTAPSIPTGLTGTSDRQGKITLSWLASTDALSGVAGYTVYRNSVSIGQATNTSFTDTSTVSGTSYAYTVSARDAVGNASSQSSAVTVKANSKPGKLK